MNIEIERKFLVNKDLFITPNGGITIKQGYLAKNGCTTRVRIANNKAYLTIKGATLGFSRAEFEYEIPVADADEMLKLSLYPPIEKIRYNIEHCGKIWEVDQFFGANEGLLMAEIELNSEDEEFELPNWIDCEVTGIKAYYNSHLSKRPLNTWQ